MNNLLVKSSLFQGIKEISNYVKSCKDYCFKPKKRKKYPATIHVTSHLASQMLGSIEAKKYIDPRIPIISIITDNSLIPNNLIDLGISINLMKMDTMQRLNLHNISLTPTIIELDDRLRIKPKGVI